MHDSTCESSEEVRSEAGYEYDEENPDYESDEYQLGMDFISLSTKIYGFFENIFFPFNLLIFNGVFFF